MHKPLNMLLAAGLTIAWTAAARAEPPRVVADILPVHSLVAGVMEGVGTPALLIEGAADPHHFALRPSNARALAEADLVIWIGPDLTPWLTEPLASLASEAQPLALLGVPDSRRHELREGALFAAHDEDHDHGHAHDHGSEGAVLDPHGWLDPANARLWLDAIAEALAAIDPDHGARYRANARTMQAAILAAESDIAAALTPVRAGRFFVYHDAFRYFEAHFGIAATGAVAPGDAARPGAARLSALAAALDDTAGGVCLFAEPQYDAALVERLAEGRALRLAELDRLGAALSPGPGLYPAMLRALGTAIADCLG